MFFVPTPKPLAKGFGHFFYFPGWFVDGRSPANQLRLVVHRTTKNDGFTHCRRLFGISEPSTDSSTVIGALIWTEHMYTWHKIWPKNIWHISEMWSFLYIHVTWGGQQLERIRSSTWHSFASNVSMSETETYVLCNLTLVQHSDSAWIKFGSWDPKFETTMGVKNLDTSPISTWHVCACWHKFHRACV